MSLAFPEISGIGVSAPMQAWHPHSWQPVVLDGRIEVRIAYELFPPADTIPFGGTAKDISRDGTGRLDRLRVTARTYGFYSGLCRLTRRPKSAFV